MLGSNNLSKKTRILGAVAFWLLGYTITVLILFTQINFDVVGYKDSVFTLISRPFVSVLLPFCFFIFPLLLAASSSIKRFIFSIILFGLLFFPTFLFIISWEWAHGYIEEANTRLIGSIIYLIFCFILFSICRYKKEKIIPKLILISLIFLVGLTIYITAWAKIASQTIEISKDLAQRAIEMKDTSLCEKIFEESKKGKIYSKNAGSLTQNAYTKCISYIAIGTENIQLCEKLKEAATGGYTFCLGEFARSISDPNLCVQNITKEPERYSGEWKQKIGWCFEVIFTHPTYSTDPKICEKVVEKWKGSCYGKASSTVPPPRWMNEIRR